MRRVRPHRFPLRVVRLMRITCKLCQQRANSERLQVSSSSNCRRRRGDIRRSRSWNNIGGEGGLATIRYVENLTSNLLTKMTRSALLMPLPLHCL